MMHDNAAIQANSGNNISNFQNGDSTTNSPTSSSVLSEINEDGDFSGDVESLVYYFSVVIKPIPLSAETYGFSSDPVRSKMILKFMKFYSWCPNLKGELHSQRRYQLKSRLKLLKGQFTQQLSSYMNNKFRWLKRMGLISGDNLHPPVKYHKETDHWLEQTWDGIIRLGNTKSLFETTSLKRAASPLSSQHPKLPRPRALTRSTMKICAAVNSAPQPETVSSRDRSSNQDSRSVQSHEIINLIGSNDDASENSDPTVHNLITPDDSISAIQSLGLTSDNLSVNILPITTETPSKRFSGGETDTRFNASELSALLEGICEPDPLENNSERIIPETFIGEPTACRNQTCVTGIQGSSRQICHTHDVAIVNEPPKTLETLVKCERSCRTACNAIDADMRNTKSIHDQLCIDNDKLYGEIKTFQTDFEEADKRLKSNISPTPAPCTSETTSPFDEKVPEIRRKLANPEWLESRKAAKGVLSQEIKKLNEKYKDLQAQFTVKEVELKALRATIREEKAREKRRKSEIACLLEDFEKYDTLPDPESHWISENNLESDEE